MSATGPRRAIVVHPESKSLTAIAQCCNCSQSQLQADAILRVFLRIDCSTAGELLMSTLLMNGFASVFKYDICVINADQYFWRTIAPVWL